jgi:hypothetical protein
MPGETVPILGSANQLLLQVGELVGNYPIERVHASGGNSTVYKVQHVTLKRAAALKVLHQEPAGREA